MLWLLFKVYFRLKFFLAFALDNSGCFYGWFSTCLEDTMKRVAESKYFWGNLRPVLGKLVSSNFDKNKMTPHQALRYSIISIDEICQAITFLINRGLELDRDMK